MYTYLKFDPDLRDQILQYGLTFEWLSSLFLGEGKVESVPSVLDGISPAQKQFFGRQTLTSDGTYANVRKRCFICADPWAEGEQCKALVCLTADKKNNLPIDMLPIFYKCQSTNREEFWICVYWTFGRVTQIVFPSRRLVIFDISQSDAESVISSLESLMSRYSNEIASITMNSPKVPPKCVGLLDMVTNFAHQLVNHLSGVQRLVDLALLNDIDELWICGTQFFGPVETLFPELNNRVRYFPNRWDISAELLRDPCQIFRIGSTYLSSKLRRRLLDRVPVIDDIKERNLLVVTVRAEGRMCVNLPEVIAEIYKRLRSRFDLKIALDGWVLPESAVIAASSVGAAVSSTYVTAIRNEIDIAREIQRRLPIGSIVLNSIGHSMFESLKELSSGTTYFSHIGTLQHKLGLILGLPGVVHGPKVQITDPEGGPYLAEEGVPPVFIPAEAIEDIPTLSQRGQGFSDYRVLDINFATATLAKFLQPLV
jgi:hypothetical protein